MSKRHKPKHFSFIYLIIVGGIFILGFSYGYGRYAVENKHKDTIVFTILGGIEYYPEKPEKIKKFHKSIIAEGDTLAYQSLVSYKEELLYTIIMANRYHNRRAIETLFAKSRFNSYFNKEFKDSINKEWLYLLLDFAQYGNKMGNKESADFLMKYQEGKILHHLSD